jgi:hypothetical protein
MFIGCPHGNDVAGVRAGRPDDDNHSTPQSSDANEADLAVMEALVREIQGAARANLASIGEVQAPVGQGLVTFGGVEGEFHGKRKFCERAITLH